jgi:hypothetical protein
MRHNEVHPGAKLEAALRLAHAKFNVGPYDGVSAQALVFVDQSPGEDPILLNVELKVQESGVLRLTGSVATVVVTYCQVGHPDYISEDYEFAQWETLAKVIKDQIDSVSRKVQLLRSGQFNQRHDRLGRGQLFVDYNGGGASGAELWKDLNEALEILGWSRLQPKIGLYKVTIMATLPSDEVIEISLSSLNTDRGGEHWRALMQIKPLGTAHRYSSEKPEILAELIKFELEN